MRYLSMLCATMAALALGGCDGAFRTVPDTYTPNGPANSSGSGQIAVFSASYGFAYNKALDSAKLGQLDETQAVQDAYHRMALDGFGVIDGVCDDFFKHRGEDQRWMTFTRDVVGAAGTLATGTLAIAGASTVALSIVALSTATIFSGLTIYQKDFLFGADNITSVESMVKQALLAHSTAVFSDKEPWTFQNAGDAILDHQNICKPAKILDLAQQTLSNAKAQASKTTSSTTAGGEKTTDTTTSTTGGAAPTSTVTTTTKSNAAPTPPSSRTTTTTTTNTTPSTGSSKHYRINMI